VAAHPFAREASFDAVGDPSAVRAAVLEAEAIALVAHAMRALLGGGAHGGHHHHAHHGAAAAADAAANAAAGGGGAHGVGSGAGGSHGVGGGTGGRAHGYWLRLGHARLGSAILEVFRCFFFFLLSSV
jgi:hypothetical protein